MGIDDRRSYDTHIPIHVCAAELPIVNVGGRSEVDMPIGFRGVRIVRIERIYAVIHRGYIYQIVCATAHFYIGHVEWLPVNLVVDHSAKKHAKLLRVDV